MKKGFTIIEILIVLAIISLIASVSLPNIFKVQNKAKEAAVKAICYNIQTELESYQLDSFDYPSGNDLSLLELAQIIDMPIPKNPFSGETYKSDDQAGQITYSYDQASGQYTLKAFKRDGQTILEILTNK